MEVVRNKNGTGKCLKWSDSDLSYLRDHFPTEAGCDIAEHLGISPTSVCIKAKELGLRKSKEFSRNAYSGRYVNGYKHNAMKYSG